MGPRPKKLGVPFPQDKSLRDRVHRCLNQNTLRSITPANCPYTAPSGYVTPAPSCLSHPTNVDFGTKIKGFVFVPNATVDTHFDNRSSVSYGIDQNTALYRNGDIGQLNPGLQERYRQLQRAVHHRQGAGGCELNNAAQVIRFRRRSP